MENLIVSVEKKSPIKTIEKKVNSNKKLLKDLTSELPLNSDQIFFIFSENNKDIINNILKKNKISEDGKCGYFSMKKKNKYCYSNKCYGCQIISRLIKTHLLVVDEIQIHFGRYKNKYLNFNKNKYFCSPYRENIRSNSLNTYIKREIDFLECNMTPDEEIILMSTENKHYNFIIINLIFNKILKNKEISLRTDFVWSFICRSEINKITLKPDYKNLEELTNNPFLTDYYSPVVTTVKKKSLSSMTIKNILRQLILLLYEVKDNFFVHSDPSIKYVKYNLETISFNFKNKTLTSPFKICLTLNDYSSINYNQNRFFCNFHSNLKNLGLPIEKIDIYFNGTDNYLEKNKKLNFEKEYERVRILCYKIGNKSKIFKEMMKTSGISLFNQSFEFVCFLTSFICDNLFFDIFKDCETEFKLWKGLWKKEEFLNLMGDLEKIRSEENNFKNILNVLKNYYIRFDALEYFYQNFK